MFCDIWTQLFCWEHRPIIYFDRFLQIPTVVEGDQKAPFSTATTLRCKGERCSFPWIAPLYPWYIPYIPECYQVPFFESLVWRVLGLNPGPGPLANALPTRPMCRLQIQFNQNFNRFVSKLWLAGVQYRLKFFFCFDLNIKEFY